MKKGVVVVAALLALEACFGVVLGEHFLFGTLFSVVRWPGIAVALVLIGVALVKREGTWRQVVAVAMIAVVIHGGDAIWESATRARPVQTLQGPGVRIATANLRMIVREPELTLGGLEDTDADVLVLQEVTHEWAKIIEARFGSTYPHKAMWPHHTATGAAILSRHPLGEVALIRAGLALPAAQVVVLETPSGRYALANVHLLSPSGPLRKAPHRIYSGLEVNAATRRRQWRAIRAHLEHRHGDLPHLVIGDFNTTEYEPLWREISAQYVDTYRSTTLSPGWTWPVGRPPAPFPFVRIDYAFTSPEVAVGSARVLPEGGSDHRALLVVLK